MLGRLRRIGIVGLRFFHSKLSTAFASFQEARSAVWAFLCSMKDDTVRDMHSAKLHLRSWKASILWCLSPPQLSVAFATLKRVTLIAGGVVYICFILGFPGWTLLFHGAWYEEHRFIPQPEPGRTIWLSIFFSIGAIWLYILRCRERLAYGCLEILIAMLTFYFTVIEPRTVGEAALDRRDIIITTLQIAAGLYIFVRGLDNIGQSLPLGSAAQAQWQKFFSRKSTDGKATAAEIK